MGLITRLNICTKRTICPSAPLSRWMAGEFRIDRVDFDKGKVSLQDMALADMRMPIFREEPLAIVRELYEQQDEALDAAPEKAR